MLFGYPNIAIKTLQHATGTLERTLIEIQHIFSTQLGVFVTILTSGEAGHQAKISVPGFPSTSQASFLITLE